MLIHAFKDSSKEKLKEKWDSQPYVVLEKSPNLPIYCLQPDRRKGYKDLSQRLTASYRVPDLFA